MSENQSLCPYCKEEVHPEAVVCKHCHKQIKDDSVHGTSPSKWDKFIKAILDIIKRVVSYLIVHGIVWLGQWILSHVFASIIIAAITLAGLIGIGYHFSNNNDVVKEHVPATMSIDAQSIESIQQVISNDAGIPGDVIDFNGLPLLDWSEDWISLLFDQPLHWGDKPNNEVVDTSSIKTASEYNIYKSRLSFRLSYRHIRDDAISFNYHPLRGLVGLVIENPPFTKAYLCQYLDNCCDKSHCRSLSPIISISIRDWGCSLSRQYLGDLPYRYEKIVISTGKSGYKTIRVELDEEFRNSESIPESADASGKEDNY